MTAKDFVRQKYPNAICKRIHQQNSYDPKYSVFFIDENGVGVISEGSTESNAWVKAKAAIQKATGTKQTEQL